MCHLNTLSFDIYSTSNVCCDMKLCSKIGAQWVGVQGPSIPVSQQSSRSLTRKGKGLFTGSSYGGICSCEIRTILSAP